MNESAIKTETRFSGLPISGGIALARVCLFNDRRHSNLPSYRVVGEGAELEKGRVQQAIKVAGARMDTLIQNVMDRIGPAEAQIFKAQKMILNDKTVVKQMLADIETMNLNAESTVTRTLEAYESRLLQVDDEYIQGRASDIGEVRRRLLDVLRNMNPSLQCAGEEHCQRGRNRIVVAEELTPGLTVDLDTENTRGFVSERGGPNSHAAILAKSLGIPAVSGIAGIRSKLSCGTELLLNGDTGELIVWPGEDTLARFQSVLTATVKTAEPVEPVAGLTVMANINRATEVTAAVDMLAEGIGLYRTEFEFLAAGRILSEDEQWERYSTVVRAMQGKAVYFRMLDIGGDKGAPFLKLPREENPYLGLRGSRLLLARDDLLITQARALARASAEGPVHVMYPMIIDVEQFLKLKDLFQKATAGLSAGDIRHGVMFEVPSACLQARELLEAADFASIGTNDLIQYLFAVDRNNEFVAYDYMPDRPVFWSLMEQMAQAAQQVGRPLSVCGEIAGNAHFLAKLMELGIDTISVSPRLIPHLRQEAAR